MRPATPSSHLSPLTSHLSPLTSHLSPLTSRPTPCSRRLSRVLACVHQLRFVKSQTLLMIKVLEPRLLRGEAELIEGGVSQRRDRGLVSLRFRQVAPPTDETFISRLALRRLQTHLLSDHFLGTVMDAAREALMAIDGPPPLGSFGKVSTGSGETSRNSWSRP